MPYSLGHGLGATSGSSRFCLGRELVVLSPDPIYAAEGGLLRNNFRLGMRLGCVTGL